jgi:hypothetical protein
MVVEVLKSHFKVAPKQSAKKFEDSLDDNDRDRDYCEWVPALLGCVRQEWVFDIHYVSDSYFMKYPVHRHRQIKLHKYMK